jgi:hypothetical protein
MEVSVPDVVSSALCRLHPALVRDHGATILAAPGLEPMWRQRMQRLLTLARMGPEELWVKFTTRVSLDRPDQWDWEELRDLGAMMAEHAAPLGPRVMEVVDDPNAAGLSDWCVYELAGWLRLHDAAPALMRAMFAADDESDIGEPLMIALGRIGDPSVIEPLASRFYEQPVGFRFYCSGLLDRLRYTESERWAVKLLEHADDDCIVSCLCSALVQLGTNDEHALELMRGLARDGRYDMFNADLREELIALHHMIGRDLPEADSWRRAIAADRFERRRGLLALETSMRNRRSATDMKPSSVETFHRIEPKVGRNDPCPCGSGRKYKKCCRLAERTAEATFSHS